MLHWTTDIANQKERDILPYIIKMIYVLYRTSFIHVSLLLFQRIQVEKDTYITKELQADQSQTISYTMHRMLPSSHNILNCIFTALKLTHNECCFFFAHFPREKTQRKP